jgi:hypothetical protein
MDLWTDDWTNRQMFLYMTDGSMDSQTDGQADVPIGD